MICYIFTGGQVYADSMASLGLERSDGDLVIAADSGYLTAKKLGVKPDLLLGDLDSLDQSQLDAGELDALEKKIVPPIKDDTDTQLAVDTAILRGADEIVIIGGLGGRLDHTLSSVFLLETIAERGVRCMMTDGRNRVRVMRGGETLRVMRSAYRYLSLISLCDVCTGVYIRGVFYPLDNVELSRKYSYAVSNEITADQAEISLGSGVMLVIESRD